MLQRNLTFGMDHVDGGTTEVPSEYNYCLHNVNNHVHTYDWETIRPEQCLLPRV